MHTFFYFDLEKITISPLGELFFLELIYQAHELVHNSESIFVMPEAYVTSLLSTIFVIA